VVRASDAAHSLEWLLLREPVDASRIWQTTHHYRRNPAFFRALSEMGKSRLLLHYASQELRLSNTSAQTLSVCEAFARADLPICDCMNVAKTKALLWSGEGEKAFHILEQRQERDELGLDWCNMAIRMHAAAGDFSMAEQSLRSLQSKSVATSLSFLPLIVNHAKAGREARAAECLEEMVQCVGKMSNTIYYDLISALCLTDAYKTLFDVCVKALADGYRIPLRKILPLVVEFKVERKSDQATNDSLRNLVKHLVQRFKSLQTDKSTREERAELLLILSKAGKTGLVYELSELMHPSELSPQTWDQIVRAFIDQGMSREAESILVQSLVGKSQNRPGKPRTSRLPEGSYVYFLSHLIRNRRFNDFTHFAGLMENYKLPPSIFVVNHILKGYIAMRQYGRIWRAYPALLARREEQPDQKTWRQFWHAMFKDSYYNTDRQGRPSVRSLFADMAAASAFKVDSRHAAYVFRSFLHYNDQAGCIVALAVLRSKFKLIVTLDLLVVVIQWHVGSLERKGMRDAAENESLAFCQAVDQSKPDSMGDHLHRYLLGKLGEHSERDVADARRDMDLGLEMYLGHSDGRIYLATKSQYLNHHHRTL